MVTTLIGWGAVALIVSGFECCDVREPVFLTPFIERGDLDGGRNSSLVRGLEASTADGQRVPVPPSYSGFLTVNKQYQSNLFFWFFPATRSNERWEESPLILWLQGGPGASSMFGLLTENGPLQVTESLTLKLRDYQWTEHFNVLYIDNPVGTGFSFTVDEAGYAQTEVDVGRDLYTAISQFLTLFPALRKVPLYITGESYAGKYVPAIAFTIHQNNAYARRDEEWIALAGLAIGNGFIDPVSMSDYADLLYGIGLIDEIEKDLFTQSQNAGVEAMNRREFKKAFYLLDEMIGGDLVNESTLFYNCTGLNTYYNYLWTEEPEDMNYYTRFLELPEIRRAIHVGNISFDEGETVEVKLLLDVMKSSKEWLEKLLNSDYKVMLYSGQLDIVVGYPLTRNFLKTLNWKYSQEYWQTRRKIWRVHPEDRDVAGYVKNTRNFWDVLVRNAGHIVPYDQPRAAKDLIEKFIWGTL